MDSAKLLAVDNSQLKLIAVKMTLIRTAFVTTLMTALERITPVAFVMAPTPTSAAVPTSQKAIATVMATSLTHWVFVEAVVCQTLMAMGFAMTRTSA